MKLQRHRADRLLNLTARSTRQIKFTYYVYIYIYILHVKFRLRLVTLIPDLSTYLFSWERNWIAKHRRDPLLLIKGTYTHIYRWKSCCSICYRFVKTVFRLSPNFNPAHVCEHSSMTWKLNSENWLARISWYLSSAQIQSSLPNELLGSATKRKGRIENYKRYSFHCEFSAVRGSVDFVMIFSLSIGYF